MKLKETLYIALQSGEILLTSGSEIYRVEDTIERICSAYGVKCESFVTPTGIFVSGWNPENPDETISLIKRIKDRSINLHKIEMINTFSRSLQTNKVSYEAAIHMLKDVEKAPYFSFFKRLLAAGFTSSAYSILFMGSYLDAAIAGSISIIIYSLYDWMKKINISQYFRDFLCSFLAGILSLGVGKLIGALNANIIIVGSIMILVPGLAITNGIRDAMHGDILSSLARVGEALFTVTVIGVGVGVALLLMK